jgi:hypothetical protein
MPSDASGRENISGSRLRCPSPSTASQQLVRGRGLGERLFPEWRFARATVQHVARAIGKPLGARQRCVWGLLRSKTAVGCAVIHIAVRPSLQKHIANVTPIPAIALVIIT